MQNLGCAVGVTTQREVIAVTPLMNLMAACFGVWTVEKPGHGVASAAHHG